MYMVACFRISRHLIINILPVLFLDKQIRYADDKEHTVDWITMDALFIVSSIRTTHVVVSQVHAGKPFDHFISQSWDNQIELVSPTGTDRPTGAIADKCEPANNRAARF